MAYLYNPPAINLRIGPKGREKMLKDFIWHHGYFHELRLGKLHAAIDSILFGDEAKYSFLIKLFDKDGKLIHRGAWGDIKKLNQPPLNNDPDSAMLYKAFSKLWDGQFSKEHEPYRLEELGGLASVLSVQSVTDELEKEVKQIDLEKKIKDTEVQDRQIIMQNIQKRLEKDIGPDWFKDTAAISLAKKPEDFKWIQYDKEEDSNKFVKYTITIFENLRRAVPAGVKIELEVTPNDTSTVPAKAVSIKDIHLGNVPAQCTLTVDGKTTNMPGKGILKTLVDTAASAARRLYTGRQNELNRELEEYGAAEIPVGKYLAVATYWIDANGKLCVRASLDGDVTMDKPPYIVGSSIKGKVDSGKPGKPPFTLTAITWVGNNEKEEFIILNVFGDDTPDEVFDSNNPQRGAEIKKLLIYASQLTDSKDFAVDPTGTIEFSKANPYSPQAKALARKYNLKYCAKQTGVTKTEAFNKASGE